MYEVLWLSVYQSKPDIPLPSENVGYGGYFGHQCQSQNKTSHGYVLMLMMVVMAAYVGYGGYFGYLIYTIKKYPKCKVIWLSVSQPKQDIPWLRCYGDDGSNGGLCWLYYKKIPKV